MDTLNKISDGIEKITDYVLIFAFASMTLVFFSGIVARYALNTGIQWAEEYTRYANVAMVYLAAATISKYNGHTNVSVLELSVKGGAKRFVIILQQVLSIVFFGFAAAIGFNFAGSISHVSANLRLPMSIMYNIMSVAFVLLVFQTIVSILNMIKEGEDE